MQPAKLILQVQPNRRQPLTQTLAIAKLAVEHVATSDDSDMRLAVKNLERLQEAAAQAEVQPTLPGLD